MDAARLAILIQYELHRRGFVFPGKSTEPWTTIIEEVIQKRVEFGDVILKGDEDGCEEKQAE